MSPKEDFSGVPTGTTQTLASEADAGLVCPVP